MPIIVRQNKFGEIVTLSNSLTDKTKTVISHKGKHIEVDCPLEEMLQRYYNWQMRDMRIQEAFDNLNSSEREFLLTGITKEEWDKMFADE